MVFRFLLSNIFFLINITIGICQIIQINPAFPTVNDVITLHYDATQGNGGLVGVSPVYTHTGVITQNGLPNSWSYVQGSWGQADTNVLMTDLGNNIHELIIDIDQYYGFPPVTNVAKLAFVFRNADGSLEGKTASMGDIFYPIYPVNGGFQAAIIKPYTDLLLHDMGEGLADGIEDSLASGSEWRTPPLWGIGLTKTVNGNTFFLHDGRARSIEEAILWHGGEGSGSRKKYSSLSLDEKTDLLNFINSL